MQECGWAHHHRHCARTTPCPVLSSVLFGSACCICRWWGARRCLQYRARIPHFLLLVEHSDEHVHLPARIPCTSSPVFILLISVTDKLLECNGCASSTSRCGKSVTHKTELSPVQLLSAFKIIDNRSYVGCFSFRCARKSLPLKLRAWVLFYWWPRLLSRLPP